MPAENKNPGEAKSLYKETLPLGQREYTFEFRESARGNRFLNVTDSHERNGKWTRDSVVVFEDQLGPFLDALQRAVASAAKTEK